MQKLKTLLQYNYKIIFLILAVFFITLIRISIPRISKYDAKTSIITGEISAYSINGNVLKMDIKAKENIKATYYIKSEEEKDDLLKSIKLGTQITLTGNLEKPSNNTIPNTFNYQKYLYNNHIFWLFNVSEYKLSNQSNFLYQFKDMIQKRIYSLAASDYLLVLILGDKALLDSDNYQNFQLNGTAHLLAISGMHIGLLLACLEFCLKKLEPFKKLLIISIILAFFAFLTNFTASVMRVILFYILLNLNRIFKLNYSNLQILLFVASILVLIDPFYIFNYGFLYSLIITGGIIYAHNIIKGNYVQKLIILSAITFLFSLPITASLNYEINLMSILANLIFVPLVTFVIYPLALITIFIPNVLWVKLVMIMNSLNNWLINFKLVINIPKMPFIIILIYYMTLLISLKKPKYLPSLLVIIIIVKSLPKISNHYEVYFLDVGQGDSAVIMSPHKEEVILIDTGGKISYQKSKWQETSKKYNLSDNTIKFLKSKGVTKLDYLILSHGDADHAGEALNIIKNMKVLNVILNEGEVNNLEKEIMDTNVHITNTIKLNSIPIFKLSHELQDNENDNSLIYYLSLFNYNLLFLGDASKTVEEEILNKYELDIDIVKLAHHGSKTSTSASLLEKRPSLAIISSGRNNRYNHPSEETIENLNKKQIQYLNTQDTGTIFLDISFNAYTIMTYPP